nr:Chain A, hIAPP(15-25)WT [Homo sapiens]5KO0_B Chain B, hIAPP(15-25)WT [Homo sapiens]
FLVHSSNNFGA